jgi:integrase
LTELETTIQEDKWTQQNQLYYILQIYLIYWGLRPSELLDLKITDTDCEGNYINVSIKQIVIRG